MAKFYTQAFFVKHGSRGGKIGGKLNHLTPEEAKRRGQLGGLARAAKARAKNKSK